MIDWAEIDQRMAQAKREALAEARLAIANGRPSPDALQSIFGYTVLFDSEKRLPAVLDLIEHSETFFWPVLAQQWVICDDTWMYRPRLLAALRRFGPAPGLNLPDQLSVFRGCSLERVRGVSWTTDRAVAEDFAFGHRDIRVPNPVLASAVVPRSGVFAAINERKESEILLDPDLLSNLSIAPK